MVRSTVYPIALIGGICGAILLRKSVLSDRLPHLRNTTEPQMDGQTWHANFKIHLLAVVSASTLSSWNVRIRMIQIYIHVERHDLCCILEFIPKKLLENYFIILFILFFVHIFIYSIICLLIYLFVRLFARSFIHSFKLSNFKFKFNNFIQTPPIMGT